MNRKSHVAHAAKCKLSELAEREHINVGHLLEDINKMSLAALGNLNDLLAQMAAPEGSISLKMTKPESWAVVRATAEAQTSENIPEEDKPQLAWAGQRLLNILDKQL